MANRMGTDLTEGSIVKHLINFSIPLLLGNVFQALYNTVDSIWVGQFLGAKALGAVSVSFPIIFILISLVTGITMATSVLVAQYAGAKNPEMISKTMNNSFLLLGTVAVIVTTIGIVFNEQILILLNTPQEILAFAVEYLNIYLLGLIFVFGFNVMSAVLNGLGDPRTPVKFLIVATITNIILDPLFIFGVGFIPKMGIAGAALATIISQALALALIVIYLYRTNHIIRPKIKDFKVAGELFVETDQNRSSCRYTTDRGIHGSDRDGGCNKFIWRRCSSSFRSCIQAGPVCPHACHVLWCSRFCHYGAKPGGCKNRKGQRNI